MALKSLKKYLTIGTLALGFGLTSPVYSQNNSNNHSLEQKITQETTLKLYITGVDNTIINGSTVEIYNNQTGQLLATTTLNNSYAQTTITGIKDKEQPKNNTSKIYGNNGQLTIENNTPAKITLYNILGQKILTKETEEQKTKINLEQLANAPYIITIKKENNTETKKIIKTEKEIYTQKENNTETNNITSDKPQENIEYKIKIKGPTHYTRTITTETPQDTIKDHVVEHVQQDGVTDTLFYELCKEANFMQAIMIEGLKTYIPQNNPNNNKIIILNKGPPQKPYTITTEDMQYIKNLIETEIYPHMKTENRPTIELRTLNSHELIIANTGETIIIPGTGYYIGPHDDNQDGIIDRNNIELMANKYQDTNYTGQKLQEILSAFIAPNQVDGGLATRFAYKTVLSSGAPTKKLTEIDKKLIKIGETYKPKTPIEEILGLQ